MDNFLDRYHISKLNQDCTNDTNKSKTLKEIDTVIKNLSHKKAQHIWFQNKSLSEFQRRANTNTHHIVLYNKN